MKDVRSSDVSSGRGFQVSAACAHHKRCFASLAVTASREEIVKTNEKEKAEIVINRKEKNVAEKKVWAIEAVGCVA